MEAVWITLVVFGFALAVFLILVFRFPEEVSKLLGRMKSVLKFVARTLEERF